MARSTRGTTSPALLTAARDQRLRMTAAEARLWEQLRDRRLNGIKFRRLHPFGPFILDFFAVRSMLAIEVDGGVHRRPEQAAYDQERTLVLQDLGVRLIRFTNEQIETDLQRVLADIVSACSEP